MFELGGHDRTGRGKRLSKDEFYEEWKEEVLDEKSLFYNSYIASLPEGRILTRVWRLYRNNNENSIVVLQNVKGSNEIVEELKQILICLLYLKNFRINIIGDELDKYVEGNFTDIINTYKNYHSIIYDKEVISSHLIEEEKLNFIPFLEEDKKMIRNLNYIIHDKKTDNNSWIELLLLNKIEIKKGNKDNVYEEQLKKLYKYIPISPEKGEILKDFNI